MPKPTDFEIGANVDRLRRLKTETERRKKQQPDWKGLFAYARAWVIALLIAVLWISWACGSKIYRLQNENRDLRSHIALYDFVYPESAVEVEK
jgi:hypothetical protein